jgi:hypothetical protein
MLFEATEHPSSSALRPRGTAPDSALKAKALLDAGARENGVRALVCGGQSAPRR